MHDGWESTQRPPQLTNMCSILPLQCGPHSSNDDDDARQLVRNCLCSWPRRTLQIHRRSGFAASSEWIRTLQYRLCNHILHSKTMVLSNKTFCTPQNSALTEADAVQHYVMLVLCGTRLCQHVCELGFNTLKYVTHLRCQSDACGPTVPSVMCSLIG